LSFFVHYPESTATFDIMAVDEQNRALIIYDYGFEDGQEEIIQLRAKDLAKKMPDVSFVELTVKNALDVEVDYLFVSPSDSEAWGVDILDEQTVLASGESSSFLVPVSESAVDYNVMAVDDSGNDFQFDVTLDPAEGDTFSAAIEPGDAVE
jgi:hypothetical protein